MRSGKMMAHHGKATPIEKIAAFIVDRRKGFYLVYILLIIFSLFSTNWVQVNNEITDYLSEETETRRGLSLMEQEFITYATAEIMVDNISYSDAEKLVEEFACEIMDDNFYFDYSEYSRKNWVILHICCELEKVVKKMINMLFLDREKLERIKNNCK